VDQRVREKRVDAALQDGQATQQKELLGLPGTEPCASSAGGDDG